MKLALISAAVACIVSAWAIKEQVTVINIPMPAEDDCAYYHGAYELTAVLPTSTGVICQYDAF